MYVLPMISLVKKFGEHKYISESCKEIFQRVFINKFGFMIFDKIELPRNKIRDKLTIIILI